MRSIAKSCIFVLKIWSPRNNIDALILRVEHILPFTLIGHSLVSLFIRTEKNVLDPKKNFQNNKTPYCLMNIFHANPCSEVRII